MRDKPLGSRSLLTLRKTRILCGTRERGRLHVCNMRPDGFVVGERSKEPIGKVCTLQSRIKSKKEVRKDLEVKSVLSKIRLYILST